MSRYNQRKKFVNTKRFYQDYMEQRGVKKITHFDTPNLKYPKPSVVADEIKRITHIWSSTDLYWKLAAKYYGDPEKWWVIAWFNKRPTESHCKIGDIIYIPTPIDTVLYHYSVG